MASPLIDEMHKHGIVVDLNTSVVEIGDGTATLSDGRVVPADIVLFAIGVRPDSQLAQRFGIETGKLGGIAIDDEMRTSDPHIWAVGDATEKTDMVGGEATLTPLANIANRQGRRAADSILGRQSKVQPSQGTAIVKIFDVVAATTGWNEKRLRAAGRDYLAIHTHPANHATYYPGSEGLTIKMLIDPTDGQILGAQAVGGSGVDKRIDVLATAMRAQIPAPELLELELAYAPPFGSAKDPINVLGYIAENRLREHASADWSEVEELVAAGWLVLDVRTEEEFELGSIPGSLHIPIDELRNRMDEIPNKQLIVNCAAGQRAHVAASMLAANGYEARNLDGGWNTWLAGQAATNAVKN
jgi:rhodanese-related sulfurtransferase